MTSTERSLVSYPTTILGLCSLGWLLNQSGRLLLPALAVPIKGSIEIGNVEFGLGLSLLWGIYAITQYPAGIVSDETGYKSVLVGSLAVASVGFVFVIAVSTYHGFLLSTVLIGLGIGFFPTSSRILLSDLFEDRSGWALGVNTAAGDVGGVITPLVATVVIGTFVWQSAFLFVGCLLLAIAVGFHLALADSFRFERPRIREKLRGTAAQIREPSMLILVLTAGVFAFAWQGAVSFIPIYIVEEKGLSIGVGNSLLSLFFVTGVAIKPLAGRISDAIGRRAILTASLLFSGIALFALTLTADALVPIVLAVSVFGVTLMAFPPVVQAGMLDGFDDEDKGGAFGLARTGYLFIGSAGPVVVGLGSETIGFDLTFGIIAFGLVVSAVELFRFSPE